MAAEKSSLHNPDFQEGRFPEGFPASLPPEEQVRQRSSGLEPRVLKEKTRNIMGGLLFIPKNREGVSKPKQGSFVPPNFPPKPSPVVRPEQEAPLPAVIHNIDEVEMPPETPFVPFNESIPVYTDVDVILQKENTKPKIFRWGHTTLTISRYRNHRSPLMLSVKLRSDAQEFEITPSPYDMDGLGGAQVFIVLKPDTPLSVPHTYQKNLKSLISFKDPSVEKEMIVLKIEKGNVTLRREGTDAANKAEFKKVTKVKKKKE